MRYLLPIDIPTAHRRGKSVEQFLGRSPADASYIRHIELRPSGQSIDVWVYDVEDVGNEDWSDFYDFPYLDADGPDCPVATFSDSQSAVMFASTALAADTARWVNLGVAESEYLDYIRAGRPPTWPVAV